MHKPSASVCLGIVLEKKWDGDSAVTLKPVAAVSSAPAKGSTLQSKVYSTTQRQQQGMDTASSHRRLHTQPAMSLRLWSTDVEVHIRKA